LSEAEGEAKRVHRTPQKKRFRGEGVCFGKPGKRKVTETLVKKFRCIGMKQGAKGPGGGEFSLKEPYRASEEYRVPELK